MPRRQIGLSDQEIADARKISTVPSQSISKSAPTDQYKVRISSPSGDKGEQTVTEREIFGTDHEDDSSKEGRNVGKTKQG